MKFQNHKLKYVAVDKDTQELMNCVGVEWEKSLKRRKRKKSIPAGKPYREISSGEMLKHFLEEIEITPYRLAKETGISHASISRILSDEARITPAIALKFAVFFENTAQFWLNCQNAWDLAHVEKNVIKSLKDIRPYSKLILATA